MLCHLLVDLETINPSDLKRCENTLDQLSKTLKNVDTELGKIQIKRACLFDETYHIKPYCTLELQKMDVIIENFEKLKTILGKKLMISVVLSNN